MAGKREERRGVVIQPKQAGEGEEHHPRTPCPHHGPILPVRPTTSVAIDPLMRVHMVTCVLLPGHLERQLVLPHRERERENHGERERERETARNRTGDPYVRQGGGRVQGTFMMMLRSVIRHGQLHAYDFLLLMLESDPLNS